MEKTKWSISDFRLNSENYLLPIINKTVLEFQKELILKAIHTYIEERLRESDRHKIFSRFSKKDKIEAASALFARMNGDKTIKLSLYKEILTDGRLFGITNLCETYTRRIALSNRLAQSEKIIDSTAAITAKYRKHMSKVQTYQSVEPLSDKMGIRMS
ncbi:hypothetical protein [Legionella quinlivanii]|nr:hypothetical protein [Legionella quinlivanii]